MQPDTLLVNRYQLQRELSYKAGRRTFLAEDTQTQQRVIAKILQFDQLLQWDEFRLFERETQTLQNLDHPAIPKYLDSFELEQDQIHYYVLIQTYIEAPSLEQLIQEGRKFSEAEVKELGRGILTILTYLQEQNPPVIHRDIKPSNILLNNRSGHSLGDIYLVDFGAVQTVVNKESGTITIVGSYGYMPLEQFSGKTTLASDLYSLGMTLIYVLTGVHPADLPQENGQVKFNQDGISPAFLRWLKKITYPYLDKRFNSAKNALNALNIESKNEFNTVATAPPESTVKLYRNEEKIEIIISQATSKSKFLKSVFLLSIFMAFIFKVIEFISYLILFPFMYHFLSSLTGNLAYFVWLSPILFIFLYLVLPAMTGIALSLFAASRLHLFDNLFNHDKIISIDKEKNIIREGKFIPLSKNIRWEPSSLAENINGVVYQPGYKFDRENDKQYKRGKVTVSPKLSIYVGSTEYSIEGKLSQAEYWWLAQELSDFLGLEITIIYPTPKVPPEPSPPPR